MERGEWMITILGLVATFCLPWPGAKGDAASSPAVRSGVVAAGNPSSVLRVAGEVQPVARIDQPAR